MLSERVTASGSTGEACSSSLRSGAGIEHEPFTSPGPSTLTATLSGGNGDWDLIVFSKRTGEPVAGSAQPGSEELAEGYAFSGEKLIAQACALEGATGSPQLEVGLTPIEGKASPAPSLLRVSTPTGADAAGAVRDRPRRDPQRGPRLGRRRRLRRRGPQGARPRRPHLHDPRRESEPAERAPAARGATQHRPRRVPGRQRPGRRGASRAAAPAPTGGCSTTRRS